MAKARKGFSLGSMVLWLVGGVVALAALGFAVFGGGGDSKTKGLTGPSILDRIEEGGAALAGAAKSAGGTVYDWTVGYELEGVGAAYAWVTGLFNDDDPYAAYDADDDAYGTCEE